MSIDVQLLERAAKLFQEPQIEDSNGRVLTYLFDGLGIDYQRRTYEQIIETMHWGDAVISGNTDSAIWLCEHCFPEWTIAELRFNQNDDKTWHCELRKGHLTAYSSVVIAGGFSKYSSGLQTPALSICLALVRILITDEMNKVQP